MSGLSIRVESGSEMSILTWWHAFSCIRSFSEQQGGTSEAFYIDIVTYCILKGLWRP